jgi:hypothetical protein
MMEYKILSAFSLLDNMRVWLFRFICLIISSILLYHISENLVGIFIFIFILLLFGFYLHTEIIYLFVDRIEFHKKYLFGFFIRKQINSVLNV